MDTYQLVVAPNAFRGVENPLADVAYHMAIAGPDLLELVAEQIFLCVETAAGALGALVARELRPE